MNRLSTTSFCICVILAACGKSGKEITITNHLGIDRSSETVSLSVKDLLPDVDCNQDIVVKDAGTGEPLLYQIMDLNGDDIADELLFQVDIKAKDKKKIIIENGEAVKIETEGRAYSRFVPERTDDYAWENDLVAFRTYGPEAQRIVEAGEPGGSYSSGADCWFKRVNYPIIDKWYKNAAAGISYHVDHGEGMDAYHVGTSRGIGGIGVWLSDSMHTSKNFVEYKRIANGPIRTIFELTYAPWGPPGTTIREKKRISLDLGSQLSKWEVHYESSDALPNLSIGVTLHDNKGQVAGDSIHGWFSYWEPMEDSELGTGIVLDPERVISYVKYVTPKTDLSHLYVITQPQNDKLTYFTGFGWKKAGRFKTAGEWQTYLADFSKRQKSPLTTRIN